MVSIIKSSNKTGGGDTEVDRKRGRPLWENMLPSHAIGISGVHQTPFKSVVLKSGASFIKRTETFLKLIL